MAAASAAHARAVFELKSATLPLIAVVLKTADLGVLAQALAEKLADTPDFFEHDPVVIDLALLAEHGAADAAIDFPALRALLERHNTLPVAVRGATPAQVVAARAAGLAEAPDAPAPQARPAPAAAGADAASTAAAAKPALRGGGKGAAAAAPAPDIVREVPVPAAGTLVIDRPLRSGQQIYARGGDLVVLDVVNFGAEVIADGNVHVYAPLRGKAIAGARGNTEARIFTTCLEPELVSIAGIYRTTEVAIPPALAGKPAQIRLVGEKLVMEPL